MNVVRFIVATVFVALLIVPLIVVAALFWAWCKLPDWPKIDSRN